MAASRKAQKADPVVEAAVDYFSARSHDAWRKTSAEDQSGAEGQAAHAPARRRHG